MSSSPKRSVATDKMFVLQPSSLDGISDYQGALRYEAKMKYSYELFFTIPSLSEEHIDMLLRTGYENLVDIVDLEPDQLMMLLEVSEEEAVQILADTDQRIIEILQEERRMKEDIPEEAE